MGADMRSKFLAALIAALIFGQVDGAAAAFTFAGYTCCYTLPSESMLPTLKRDSYLAAVKYFDNDLPKAGDVIIFKLPRGPLTLYAKRVVGVPGDRIQMLKGELQINGVTTKRELVGDYLAQGEATPSGKRWKETLPNGVSYETLDLTESVADNTGIYTVPSRNYFVLGDNRDNSTDSRFPAIGYIPVEDVLGKVIRPWDRFFD